VINLTLWKQQKEASRLCRKHKQYLVNISPGGGKTIAALDVLDKLRPGVVEPRVILCPKSAVDAWETDIKKFTDFTYSTNNFRDDVFLNIYTFPNLDELFNLFKKRQRLGTLIIDEVHILCSSDSDQAGNLRGRWIFLENGERQFKGILDFFQNKYGFSATLMKNKIESVYYLIISFFPGFFSDLESFMLFYTIRKKRKITVWCSTARKQVPKYYMEVVGYRNLDILEKHLKKIMYQYDIDYGQKIYTQLIDLPEHEMDLYHKVGAGALGKSSRHFAARLPGLQRVANGSINPDGTFRSDVQLFEKEKALVKLLNIINDRKEGAIVFTQDKETTIRRFDIVKSRLNFKKFYTLTGDTDDYHRKEIRHTLAPQECVFATRAGGVSFNFKTVNNIILYDVPWDSLDFIQEMGRITRSDSTYTDFNIYIFLAKDTIDEYKYCLVQTCIALQRKLFGGMNFAKLYFPRLRKETLIALRKSLLWGIKKSGKFVLTPNVKCAKCGRWTNYSVSNFSGGETVDNCYASFDEVTQGWVEGCVYTNTDELQKRLADKLIGRK
jgi:superfamily II DNA or RNA helicase